MSLFCVCQEENNDESVKLADFGFAKKVPRSGFLTTFCGTVNYMAPEILDDNGRGYDQRVDMWSVGVVVFVLLGGYMPFDAPYEQLVELIKDGFYKFYDEVWSNISLSAKQLVVSLMQVQPERRLTAEKALSCKWLEIEEEKLALRDLPSTRKNMNKIQGSAVLKVENAVKAVSFYF